MAEILSNFGKKCDSDWTFFKISKSLIGRAHLLRYMKICTKMTAKRSFKELYIFWWRILNFYSPNFTMKRCKIFKSLQYESIPSPHIIQNLSSFGASLRVVSISENVEYRAPRFKCSSIPKTFQCTKNIRGTFSRIAL